MNRWRLNIPMQAAGLVLTFVRGMLVYLLLGQLLWKLDDVASLHWTAWLTFWSCAVLQLACWVLYGLFDVDGDGQEPTA